MRPTKLEYKEIMQQVTLRDLESIEKDKDAVERCCAVPVQLTEKEKAAYKESVVEDIKRSWEHVKGSLACSFE